MILFHIIYYYYFKFYQNILKDDDPYVATVLALSFSQVLLINGFLLGPFLLHVFCYANKWIMIGILILLLLFNFRYFRSHGVQIIKAEPQIFGNKIISIIFVLTFFLITSYWLYWGWEYGAKILEDCE